MKSDILHKKKQNIFAKPKNKNGIFQIITAIRTKKRLWKQNQ